MLGAGVIGVTTAWYLRALGHDVRVLERQPAPALETSFANAGQVSAHLAEPWSNPQTPRMLPRWLLQDDALHRQLSQAGPHVAAHFSIPNMADRVLTHIGLPLRAQT